MTLSNELEKAQKEGIIDKVTNNLPQKQLDDYDDENLTNLESATIAETR